MIKITNLALLASFVSALTASGATYFLPGVSRDSGWHDADKVWSQEKNDWDGDGLMCWAAQSACMASYWQDWYVKAGGDLGNAPTGYTIRADGFKESNVFNAFKTNWSNGGGLCEFGLPWYFTGTPPSSYYDNGYYRHSDWGHLTNTNSGGYFSDRYGNESAFIAGTGFEEIHYSGDGLQRDEFKEALDKYILEDHCVLGLSLLFTHRQNGMAGGHAVTCWGYETNEADELVALYITDSDDKKNGLVRCEVNYKDERGKDIMYYDVALPEYLSEEFRDDYWVTIDTFYALSVKEFTDVVIPEPSVFGLLAGVVAITIAGTRRPRRKKTT